MTKHKRSDEDMARQDPPKASGDGGTAGATPDDDTDHVTNEIEPKTGEGAHAQRPPNEDEVRRKAKKLEKRHKKAVDKHLQRELAVDKKELKRLKKRLARASRYPSRGVETWFRLTSRNLYTRRRIVDSKANILITVNSLILSVVLGTLYRNLNEDPHLLYAIVPLVVTNLISIAFAIFASKPRLRQGVFSEKDLLEHRVSLMTFDDYYAMPAEEYERALDQVMQDRDLLYGTMKRDIYALGVDLSVRYKQIQRAYGVFLFGIIVATIMFGLCHALFS